LEFQSWLASVAGNPSLSATTPVPVAFPGFNKVTVGAPQALLDGLTVVGPLDGVFIVITSVPYPVGYYGFGSLRSYTRMGAITFLSDDGQAEIAQPLGFDHNIVCPKVVRRAASAVIRLTSGVTGTVTPWTVNYPP
jgi:hypothetical protein